MAHVLAWTVIGLIGGGLLLAWIGAALNGNDEAIAGFQALAFVAVVAVFIWAIATVAS